MTSSRTAACRSSSMTTLAIGRPWTTSNHDEVVGTPRPPRLYLFKGLVEALEGKSSPKGYSEEGLAALDDAIDLRDSSVARAVRARARAYVAMGTGDPADAGRAVEDVQVAKAMLRDN